MRLRRALGSALGLVARAWLASLRVRVEAPPGLAAGDRPWCLALLHGQQFGLLAWPRRRPVVALVSRSRDGELLARALLGLGLEVARGSSSRGGAAALRAIVRRLRRGGADAAFAVDGPRGPAGSVRPGALAAARAAGALVVPIACAARPAFVFRSWDAFELPLPFARVAIALGEPIDVDRRAALDEPAGPARRTALDEPADPARRVALDEPAGSDRRAALDEHAGPARRAALDEPAGSDRRAALDELGASLASLRRRAEALVGAPAGGARGPRSALGRGPGGPNTGTDPGAGSGMVPPCRARSPSETGA
ncbi:MAG TPA: DUF374 domain-containing protein [Polyangiaceae bacterium]|nr:DUF374 domain-containing protein [Polyangiaceae bacterium]